MSEYVVISPCYEILRYGHDKIKNSVRDIHTAGKLAKFVIGEHDLIDPRKPAEPGNFKFEDCQYEAPDIVILCRGKGEREILKGEGL